MNRNVISAELIVFVMLVLIVGFARAQYIIQQEEYKIPVNYDLLPEGKEFDNATDEAKYFLSIPEEKLKAAAPETEPEEMVKSTMYIEGDNFAMDTESKETGKATIVSDYKTGKFYYILWPQKKVMVMSASDMTEMQQKSQTAADEMMKNLSPEMRKQIEQGMQQESTAAPKPVVKATGKKMQKYGFNCEEYMVTTGEEVKVIWATGDISGLAEKVEDFSSKMNRLFPSEDEEEADEWQLVPGKIPVEVRTFETDMMSNPVINVQAVTKIEKKEPPADKFKIPGKAEGFSQGSMNDMMKEMMNIMQQGDQD